MHLPCCRCRKQGVDIPSLGKVGWEYFKGSGTETRCRPIFLPSEAFCQTYKVRMTNT